MLHFNLLTTHHRSNTAQTPHNQTEQSQAQYAKIARMVRAEFEKDNRGGLTVGLVEEGKLVWSHSYGYANEETKRITTNQTIYPIASMTKMITGIMLLQLVEHGTVHLADPVEKYVPEVKQIHNSYSWAPPITLIQLATMTSGLADNAPREMPTVLRSDPWEKQLAAVLPYLEYSYEPGTKSQYANANYAILGLALSRAANEPYVSYVKTRILDPLGMHNTTFAVTPEMEDQLVTGYFLGEGNSQSAHADNSERDLLIAAGGLLSTLDDLVKLMRFHLGIDTNKILTQKTLDESYQDIFPSDGDLRYGHGIGVDAVRNSDSHLSALGHGGLRRIGFVTSYEFDRPNKTGVIFLVNSSFGHTNYKILARRILTLLDPESNSGTGLPLAEDH